jgi:hypothetical protein
MLCVCLMLWYIIKTKYKFCTTLFIRLYTIGKFHVHLQKTNVKCPYYKLTGN